MNKFEMIILKCIRFLFSKVLSNELKDELDELINPTHETSCCDMSEGITFSLEGKEKKGMSSGAMKVEQFAKRGLGDE